MIKADVAELVDARDLKSLDGNVVRVRVPPPAPKDRLTGRSAAVTAMWVFRLWDYVARCLRTSLPQAIERQKLARVAGPASAKPVALFAGSLCAIRDAFVHE